MITPNLWTNPFEYYAWLQTFSDKYTKGWLLVDSPIPTIRWVIFYLLMVWLGPKVMKNRKPMKTVWLLVTYNLAMAALNLFICLELFVSTGNLGYSYICEPVHDSDSYNEMRIRRALWWFFFSKLLEFIDTFFFIARKKNNQLSFLHVYHHSSMLSFCWIGIKWMPSGNTFFPAMINSFVHVLMYTYYGLAALGPHMSKYLWWKKYLTIIQLVQFCMGFCVTGMYLMVGCGFPKWMNYTSLAYMVSFIILFGQFYARAYFDGNKNHQTKKNITISQQYSDLNDNLIEKVK